MENLPKEPITITQHEGVDVVVKDEPLASGTDGESIRQAAASEGSKVKHMSPTESAVPTTNLGCTSDAAALAYLLGVRPLYDSHLRMFSDQMVCNDEDEQIMNVDDWIDVDLEMILDSGCCDHIVDMADAPGYAAVLHPSPGSQRNQQFVVGNVFRVANQGQVKLRMK